MYRPSCYVVCTPPSRLDSTVHVQIQSLCSLYTPYQIRQYSSCTGPDVMQFVHPLLDQTVQFMYRPRCYVVCTPSGLVVMQFVQSRLDKTVKIMYRPSCYVDCTPLLDQTIQFMYRPSCYLVCTHPTRQDSTVHVQAQLLWCLYTPYQI